MKKGFFKLRAASIGAALIMLLALVPVTAQAESIYTLDGATDFIFSDSGITVTEGDYNGYKISGTSLTINNAGTYMVSGSCTDGSIKIKKGTVGVTLVLNGVSLTSSNTAPISCNKSSEVNIVAANGTVNTLTDSAMNNDENYPDNTEAENAVIKCKDGSKVTISGSGTLNITANGKNGIKSGVTTDEEGEAYLVIKDVTLNITASVNDAVNAEQLLNIESGNIVITAADDALHCDLVMNIGLKDSNGPKIKINNCNEGIEAATLNIYSGNIDITSTDDCLNAANSDLTDYDFSVNIYGGIITAYSSSGDGFDSNGNITVTGGTISVWTANTADNQPLDADGTIAISGGTVFAAGGSGGMGMNLNVTQPYVIYGTFANGGGNNAGNSNENMPDGQPPEIPDGHPGKEPTDGENTGIDGNPPTSGSNPTPPNPDGALGGGQQPEPPMSGTTVSVAKGNTITVKNASSDSVYSTAAMCNVGYVFFTSPNLTSGQKYGLYANETEVATSAAQIGSTSSGEQPPAAPESEKQPDKIESDDKSDTSGEEENSGGTTSEGAGTESSEEAAATTDSGTSETSSAEETQSPKTGDKSPIALIIIVLTVSAAVIAGTLVYKNKSNRN